MCAAMNLASTQLKKGSGGFHVVGQLLVQPFKDF